MITLDAFFQAILGTQDAPAAAINVPYVEDDPEDVMGDFGGITATPVAATPASFARGLLDGAGFGHGEALPLDEIILGGQKTRPLLPAGVTYWAKTDQRPFHVLFFALEKKARAVLSASVFSASDPPEYALHRIIQDALEGFERGGAGRTADRRQGAQSDTLCVVAVADDRDDPGLASDQKDREARQIVCFGTKSVVTEALEVFTVREQVKDWGDRSLAEAHLGQLFKRHFEPLGRGAAWQEAFISSPERDKAEALRDVCRGKKGPARDRKLREAVRALLDEIAQSFGLPRDPDDKGRFLKMEDLPADHCIAVAPDDTRKKGFKNRVQGMRIFDFGQRLLGYIVYVVSDSLKRADFAAQMRANNHFHNVLVIYPDEDGGVLELWQGSEPLSGRLTAGASRSRFVGAGGVVQMLSSFFVVSNNGIETPKALAHELAWRARDLRAQALGELAEEEKKRRKGPGTLTDLLARFNQALATMTKEEFADAYAQTITYGMLSARWLSRDSGHRFTRAKLPELLPPTSPFLRDLFQDLLSVNLEFNDNLRWLLDDITGLLARTLVKQVFKGAQDPSIHFYQDFLDKYDPLLRAKRGVYYTPDEVVDYMVRTVDRLLRTRFNLRLGLADATTWGEFGAPIPVGANAEQYVVQILDPATGTGTFLLHTLQVIFETMRAEYKRLKYDDETAARAWVAYVRKDLLPRINGFELMMAPYIVAHLRLGLALSSGLAADNGLDVDRWGFRFGPQDRLRVFLTNTLELNTRPQVALLGEHVADEARQAEQIKKETALLVILGNPPYERISADTDPTADWILNGKVPGRTGDKSLFDDIRDIARENTIFSHLRSLADRYVYFWRWVLWKAFEHPGGPGLVSLITNSTWLNGPGFMGLRKIVREQGEEIWAVDLGGDNRGSHPEPNVFNIETPVAITTIARSASLPSSTAADAKYRRIAGDSKVKLEQLKALAVQEALKNDEGWKQSSTEWLETLVPPTGSLVWQAFPALSDLFPWQQPGCLVSRTWPISADEDTLQRRWRFFTNAPAADRAALFATAKTGRNILTSVPGYATLASLGRNAKPEPVVRYCLRSFDRQWIFSDPRLLKTESPSLWRSMSSRQIFLCSLMSGGIAVGPALTVAAHVPDFHHFCGRGGKDTIPLYRDAAANQPNVTGGLLTKLASTLKIVVPTPEDLAAYVYALLTARQYQQRFAEALKTPGPRVPLTRDKKLWKQAVELGRRLLWLHTYAERYQDPAEGRAEAVPDVPGIAWSRPVRRMPQKPGELKYDPATKTLMVGDGVVAGVRPEVWAYEVSGMPVVKKWLGYRTLGGAGKAATSKNELDQIRQETWPKEWNDELLDLLRVLTLTLEMHPRQAALLDQICDGPLIPAAELPTPTEAERKEPKAARGGTRNLFEE
jgi:hypothetical protein